MSRTETEDTAGIMLVESESLVRPVPGVLDSSVKRTAAGCCRSDESEMFEPDEVFWRQGDRHEGIYLIHVGKDPDVLSRRRRAGR